MSLFLDFLCLWQEKMEKQEHFLLIFNYCVFSSLINNDPAIIWRGTGMTFYKSKGPNLWEIPSQGSHK